MTNSDLSGKNILVVDDEPDLREIVVDALQLIGINADESSSVAEAEERIKNTHYDVVLFDMQMPGAFGIDLLKKIKQNEDRRTIMILITGQSNFSREELYDSGVDAIFSKPYEIEQLIKSIQFLIENPDKRWLRKHDRVENNNIVSVSLDLAEGNKALNLVNFGRGGMCVLLHKPLPLVGELVKFSFSLSEGKQISGVGICRWTKTEKNQNFAGIEFVTLSPESIELVISKIRESASNSFIPRDLNKKVI